MNSMGKWSDSLCSSPVSVTPVSDALANARQAGRMGRAVAWEGFVSLRCKSQL